MPEQNKGFPVGYDTQFTGNTWKQYPEGKSWFDDENYKPFLSDDKFRYPFWLISDYHYVGRSWYQKQVIIPENWQGKSIELYLERPHWETTVWVNGQYVGLQNALGMAHRYAIGKFIQPGVNQFTISVDNRVKDFNVGIDAHSISDNTQSNWNGIVGDIKLEKRDEVYISNVQIYPDIEKKTARLEMVVKNTTGQRQSGKLRVGAETMDADTYHKVNSMTTSFNIEGEMDTLELIYKMGEDVLLWDEFNPNVYQLSVQMDTDMTSDKWEGTFGMREFKNAGKNLENNGRPVYLRGTLDCAVFGRAPGVKTYMVKTMCFAHIDNAFP